MYHDGILVLDFGGVEATSVARRLRGEQVYSELLPYDAPVEAIKQSAPRGILLAGGEGDAFSKDAPDVDPAVYALGIPVLGLGYGARILMRHLGGKLLSSSYGSRTLQVTFDESILFDELSESERVLERLDVFELPEGVIEIAHADSAPSVAFADIGRALYGMQFYPEPNDPDGLLMLRNFACGICGVQPNWTLYDFQEIAMEKLRETVGEGRALIAISGGVDSAVCAALAHKAIGDKLRLVHIDTGLMRNREREQVEQYFKEQDIELIVVNARDRFLEKLSGITDSEHKHRAVHQEYERVIDEVAQSLGSIEYLLEGTIYNDVLDGFVDPLETDQEKSSAQVLELIRMLFKEEVRDLGKRLGFSEQLVNRQPFPSAGLAVRCMGEVTREKLTMLQSADEIIGEEIEAAGLNKRIRQYFGVLTDIRTGGEPSEGYTLVLRALNPGAAQKMTVYRLPYDLLERLVERITKEAIGINRVVYDVTGFPPASVEWD